MPTGEAGPSVLIVEDHVLVAESLRLALTQEGVMAEVADLSSRSALLAAVRAQPPDLVLLDLELGGTIGDGTTLVAPCVEAGIRVVVVSGTTRPHAVARAVEQGAVGAVPKAAPFEVLLTTVLAAVRGESVMDPEERIRLVHDLRLDRELAEEARERFDRLTARERQVLRALVRGVSVAAMAEEWVVSEATVRSQVRGVLTKLGVGSQLEAVAEAVRHGWSG